MTEINIPDTEGPTKLPLRLRKVIELAATGMSNKEMAQHLGLSYGTVKQYLHEIFRILHLSNRTELALWELKRREKTVR